MFERRWAYIAAVVGLAMLTSNAAAESVLFEMKYSVPFTGQSPAGGTPWMTALFQDLGNNRVRLTMDTGVDGFSEGQGLSGNEVVEEWAFGLIGGVSANDLEFDYRADSSDAGEPSVSTGRFLGIVPYFNFDFSSDDPFGANERAVVDITVPDGSLSDLSFVLAAAEVENASWTGFTRSMGMSSSGAKGFGGSDKHWGFGGWFGHIDAFCDIDWHAHNGGWVKGFPSIQSTAIPTPAASSIGLLGFVVLAGMGRGRASKRKGHTFTG